MKPAVGHGIVFRAARPAHAEIAHGCLVAVIREIADNGKSRTAVGAINERVIKPAGLFLQIVETVGAHGNIGTYLRGIVRKILAVKDTKIVQVLGKVIVDRDLINLGSHRGMNPQIFHKSRQTVCFSFDLYHNRIIPVHDPSVHPVMCCQPVDKRTETNPLHPSLHPYQQSDRLIHCIVLRPLQIE
jgi:hypothetical protein